MIGIMVGPKRMNMTEENGTKLKLELVAPGLWVVKGWKPPGIEDFFKVSEVYSKPRPKNVRKDKPPQCDLNLC